MSMLSGLVDMMTGGVSVGMVVGVARVCYESDLARLEKQLEKELNINQVI